MKVSDLLDHAATLARDSKSVVIVASGPSQREVLRNGLRRRLDDIERERVRLVTSVADARGMSFHEFLLTEEADRLASRDDRDWVAAAQLHPRLPVDHVQAQS